VFARQVSKKLRLAHTPSAFQIRFGGCKGVLSVWQSLDGEKIEIRPSMKKFESHHNNLDVVNFSSPGSTRNYTYYLIQQVGRYTARWPLRHVALLQNTDCHKKDAFRQ